MRENLLYKHQEEHHSTIAIRELYGIEDMRRIIPLIMQLNPKLGEALIHERLEEMVERGYRCVALFEGSRCIGAGGFWVGYRFYCGKYIDLDNIVIDEAHRSQGLGAKITQWIEAIGKSEGCEVAMLDSYSHNSASHRFYFREGYTILGFHFKKDLK